MPDESPAEAAEIEAEVALVFRATRRANIYKAHRNLYLVLMTMALTDVALCLNFCFGPRPTFNPYHIDRRVPGVIFGVLGVSLIVFLNIYRNLRFVRAVLAMCFSFTMFWGISNTEQGFHHKASFQLPILYLAMAALKFPLLVEPSMNPVSRKINGSSK